MKKIILCGVASIILSCGSSKVISTKDITDKTDWLESSVDNPIINVIQKHYANNDVEIIIKKKLTTDYVKLTQTKSARKIIKTTIKNRK